MVLEHFPPPLWKVLSQEKKISAMSYSNDDYDEQYEEYCRQYEEEKVLYVDGGLSRDEDGDLYGQSYRE